MSDENPFEEEDGRAVTFLLWSIAVMAIAVVVLVIRFVLLFRDH